MVLSVHKQYNIAARCHYLPASGAIVEIVGFVSSIEPLLYRRAFCRPTGCFRNWMEYSDGRQNACNKNSMTILGADWSCNDWKENSDGRQSACYKTGMTILGADWSCNDWMEHYDGRHDACYKTGMTILGTGWSCNDWIENSVGRQDACANR
jgi:hypothetical protein